MIFSHHRFSDDLVENQILTGIVIFAIFHVWMPFCKHFSMDYGVFPLAARGMERKHGGRRFEDCVSRGEWPKKAGLLQQMMYFQSGNIALDVFTALVGKGKQFFP